MAKKIKTVIKLQLPAGRALPGPPLGTALGPQGVNLGQFVKEFNEKTGPMGDTVIPTEITVFEDRTYSFILKTPPVANLIMKAVGISKGAANPLTDKVGKLTAAQVRDIAEQKMPDLNANDTTAAENIVKGTARSMGVQIVD